MNSGWVLLAALVMSSGVWASTISFEEAVDGDHINSKIVHKGDGEPGEPEDLQLDRYTKIPVGKAIKFSRPLNSNFKLASRWNEFMISQLAGKAEPVQKSVKTVEGDVFLAYPFQVFHSEDGVLKNAILALTAYEVAEAKAQAHKAAVKRDRSERTGVLIRVSDAEGTVKVGIEQIHTDEPKAGYTVKAVSEGHVAQEKQGDDAGQKQPEENQLRAQTVVADTEEQDLANQTQVNNSVEGQGGANEEDDNDNIEVNDFDYQGVDEVTFDAAAFTPVKYSPYLCAEYSHGYFSVEQQGPVEVVLKKAGNKLSIQIRAAAKKLI